MDKDLVTLTHVCRGWRTLFISHPSLWTRLEFTNVNKTRTYLERSKALPLEIVIRYNCNEVYVDDAFLLAIPHAKRFKSITISRTGSNSLQSLTRHIIVLAPFLEELIMDFPRGPALSLDPRLSNGDFSSLRTLKMIGVANLPWRNLWNLTTFELRCPQCPSVTVTELLDFLESAPHLKYITLEHSIPSSPKPSSPRVVRLYHLKHLTVIADPKHAILLNHLSIPEKASIILEFNTRRHKSPLPGCLQGATENLENLSRITAVNLLFIRTKKFVRLVGPSGELYIFCHWEHEVDPLFDLDRRILHTFLNCFSLIQTQILTITKYQVPAPMPSEIGRSPVSRALLRMQDLHTLQLVQCNNLNFILVLNPIFSPSQAVPCPNLKEIILYVETRNAFNIPKLVDMARERAARGAKLRSIKIIGLGELLPGKEVFVLREHVTHVEYRFEERPPKWDSTPEHAITVPELRQVQPPRACSLADGNTNGALTSEQKEYVCRAIKTLGNWEMERVIQIIREGVPEVGNVYHVQFFASMTITDAQIQLCLQTTEEFEIELEYLPQKTLTDLHRFVIQLPTPSQPKSTRTGRGAITGAPN